MAAASASLALAACGGGSDSTVTTPVPAVETDRETDCNQMPRPAGCPPDDEAEEPTAPPVPFAGLNSAEKILAYTAIQKTYMAIDSPPIDLQGDYKGKAGTEDDVPLADKMALQMTAWEDRHLQPELTGSPEITSSTGDWTKVVVVEPGGSTGNIDYEFALWNTGTLTGNSIYHIGFRNQEQYNTSLTTALADRGEEGNQIFSIKKDSTLYAELWTDYSGSNTSDYLVGGIWLLMPEDRSQDWRFGGFVRGNDPNPFFPSSNLQLYTGKATYKGSLAGIHTSWEDDTPKISRLLGKVTLDADFGTTSTYGRIEGRGYDLKLDGTPARDEILIKIDMDGSGWSALTKRGDPDVGNINGINYKGAAAAMLHTLNSEQTKPATVVGTVGGRGGGNSFVASFGAREVKDE